MSAAIPKTRQRASLAGLGTTHDGCSPRHWPGRLTVDRHASRGTLWGTLALVEVGAMALWLSYANGANDNFKGVATLFGSDTTDYRRALLWGTGTTLAAGLEARRPLHLAEP